MKQLVKVACSLLFLTAIVWLSSYTNENTGYRSIKFPYKKAGFTQREAAAHLLSRFTFGATPGQVDEVVDEGVEKWFLEQLEAKLPDDSLQQKLVGYDALQMDNKAILDAFPQNNIVVRMAVKDGVIDKDSVNRAINAKLYRDKIADYMLQKGYKSQQELYRQLINQKILRATYTNNQLQEVLTSFWFNHFNVSLTKNECADFVLAYERDVIRPNVLGKFENLLLATAKSPAMLQYLDNARSIGSDNSMNPRLAAFYAKLAKGEGMSDTNMLKEMSVLVKAQNAKKTQGLNENYAREIMELHTLGVDGGYTQKDVTNAAKVLTGWSIYPTLNPYGGEAAKKALDKIGEEKLIQQGFVHDGDFAFAANKHDKTEKVVLGKTFAANGGYNEGLQLIKLLAHHTSTARFISKKLAVRFVNDNPPASLIDKMSKTFLDSDGDIKKVLLTMVSAPEFWSKEALREKTKSPFELAISAVRGLNATVSQPYQIYNWVTKMGERMYYYQAPTGFPDRGEYWINTGSLLNRMNFGLALASQRIPGVTFNLASLNNNHEPESAEAALGIYSKLLMPERDVTQTIKRLTPLINDPDIHNKIANAASTTPVPQAATTNNTMASADVTPKKQKPLKENPGKKTAPEIPLQRLMTYNGNNSMLSQVAGIIIGSPEFQRK